MHDIFCQMFERFVASCIKAGGEKSTSIAMPFTVEVIDDIQQLERPHVLQTIRHEVHRPHRIRLITNRQFVWLRARSGRQKSARRRR